MICGNCGEPGILNTANNKDFYFCRKCREEILLKPTKEDTGFIDSDFDGLTPEEEAEFEKWVKDFNDSFGSDEALQAFDEAYFQQLKGPQGADLKTTQWEAVKQPTEKAVLDSLEYIVELWKESGEGNI